MQLRNSPFNGGRQGRLTRLMSNRVSRLAPSPTGALHLGNARTFLINWAMARNAGWRLPMRIEDLDGPRVKPEAVRQTLDTLSWLGIDFDGPILEQTADLAPYRQAMDRLASKGLTFACHLSRTQIMQAASAPHAGDREIRFPPELRPRDPAAFVFGRQDANYRLLTHDQSIEVCDCFAGRVSHNPHREAGDFVVWTKRSAPAYQLAVVVDDARQGVTDVVRADDLLPSAARQILIYRALDLEPPRFCHVPLVLGPDGRRLAKRHGDTRVDHYRALGVTAERVIGLLAFWCGILPERDECSSGDFLSAFILDNVPADPIVFTEADHRWLIAH